MEIKRTSKLGGRSFLQAIAGKAKIRDVMTGKRDEYLQKKVRHMMNQQLK
jgi:hypothetical protein